MRVSWRLGSGYVESVDDYLGVLVPLQEAHKYSYSRRSGRTEFETTPEDPEDDVGTKAGEDEGESMLQMNAAEYTIEGLRKETRKGRRRWSDYESKRDALLCALS
jgi:hypothetical protein